MSGPFFLLAARLVVAGAVVLGCRAADFQSWQSGIGFRWTALKGVTGEGVGFSLIPPELTGITFANRLDERSSAANRVLEDGSGVAVGDFDLDRRVDVFFCSLTGQNALYRNLGDWKFEEVSSRVGLGSLTNVICRGSVFADVNADGWLDLLVSAMGRGVLVFLNDRQGRFIQAPAGTEVASGSMTMALADYDGNGTLDLYVANYRTDDIRDRSRIDVQRVNGQVMVAPEFRDRLLLLPDGLLEFGEPDVLYRNDGHGHFSPVSWTDGVFVDESGKALASQPRDWGLSAAFRDINGDGEPDLYVCNDYWTPDRLWLNNGKGGFSAIPRLAIRHTSENSMGVDFADLNRDGWMDFVVTDMLSRDPGRRKRQSLAQTRMNWLPGEIGNRPQIMQNTLFLNHGDGTFAEIANYSGLAASEWSWQPFFLDVDLDGYGDLIVPAGHSRDVQDLDATVEIKKRQHPWPREMGARARQQAFTEEMLTHSRLYPRLESPILAFRNLGNLKFEEVTALWGTGAPGVHQGAALGDLDGDGDLDLVVNNLNAVCSVFRNNARGARVAVRLKGLPPNTQAIGATVSLLGGVIPRQDLEIISGGRYLSGDDPLRVFALGSATNAPRIEVRWRTGKRTVIPDIKADRIYEISEATNELPNPQSPKPPTPLFVDASELIRHVHSQAEINDFERQPLLPRKLSQLGPGVAWSDVDADGNDDLIVAGGSVGLPMIFRQKERGTFEPMMLPPIAGKQVLDAGAVVAIPRRDRTAVILAGLASRLPGSVPAGAVGRYEIGGDASIMISVPSAAVGPFAVADVNGDGSLDLFVGGRVVPGRYPEAAGSSVYVSRDGQFVQHQELPGLGLASGAVFSDLDGDGAPELIVACEWGPLRVFKNRQGLFQEATRQLGLEGYTGWWNGVTTGDFDGDGRLDILASNWGCNTSYESYRRHPLRIYYGDFNRDGSVQLLEALESAETGDYLPGRRFDPMADAMPWLRDRFGTHWAYSIASVEQVLGDRMKTAAYAEAATLESVVAFNRGGRFDVQVLPAEAQWSPAFGVCVGDMDGDGREDVFLSQNFFAMEPESSRQDAGRGLWLRGDGRGHFNAVSGQESGVRIYGEQRGAALGDFDEDGRVDLAVGQNGAETKLFRNVGARPGLRVKLRGCAGNPTGIGTQLRLDFGQEMGPVREVHAGSGYWSQDSAVQVLGIPKPPTRIEVRWPGGKVTYHALVPESKEVVLNEECGTGRDTKP